jgi:hypothetical protein
MRLISLGGDTQTLTGFSHRIIIPYTDINTVAEMTELIQLYPLDSTPLAGTNKFPAGTTVTACAYRLRTVFASGGVPDVVTLGLEIGDGIDPDRYMTSGAGASALYAPETNRFSSPATTMPFTYTAADSIDALFTLEVEEEGIDTLANINAGEVEIYLAITNLDDLIDT